MNLWERTAGLPVRAGEAAFAPAAAAIVNAFATLDGERLRALPVERRA